MKKLGPRVPANFLSILSLNKSDPGKRLETISQRTVFILSTGRTGTRSLATYFDHHPDVRAVHEPRPSRGLRLWTVAYLQGAVDEPTMAKVLREYRGHFFDSMQESVYVESNNFLAGFVRSIMAEFTEPRIIHIVRDPRTYIQSAINNGAGSGLKGLANKHVPYAHLPLDLTSSNPILSRSAMYWRLLNELLDIAGRDYDHYDVYRYEDIFDPARGDFERLALHMGITPEDIHLPSRIGRINRSTQSLLESWERWPQADRRLVKDICGTLMDRYGYDHDLSW